MPWLARQVSQAWKRVETAAHTDWAPAAQARFFGYVDRIGPDVVEGWGYDRRQPDRAMLIEAVAASGRTAVGVAIKYRKDLVDAGIGTGRYGYEIALDHPDFHEGALVVRFVESGVPLISKAATTEIYRALVDSEMPPGFVALVRQLALQTQTRHAESTAEAFSRYGLRR